MHKITIYIKSKVYFVWLLKLLLFLNSDVKVYLHDNQHFKCLRLF